MSGGPRRTRDQHPARRAATPSPLVAGLALALSGCGWPGDDPHRLVVATPWPAAVRLACEEACAADGGRQPITWVELGDHRWGDACDRRGGVDLILGGPARTIQALADAGRLVAISPADPVPWRKIARPVDPAASTPDLDPRDAGGALAEARGVLAAAGWTKGYEALVRRPVEWRPAEPRSSGDAARRPVEAVGLVRGGRHPAQSERMLDALTRQGWITPAPPDADLAARTDDLLADLLGAALVDARNERRDAQMALEAHDHPAIAEAAVGAPPPWPPASVARLQADPTHAALADSLAEQVAPDPAARIWLEASWQGPKRRVDLDLLRQLGQAEGGRLVREPRFRAWLRGEWTAWTQQLYRRVARLAGGYRPS